MSDSLNHNSKAFRADFRARRRAAKLTQAEVGMAMEGRTGKIGVHPNFINGVERGQYPTLKASTMRRLNEALARAIYMKNRDKEVSAWPELHTALDRASVVRALVDRRINDLPPAISRKLEAIELFLLFLASVAVGALAVLAYNVMNGV